MRVEFDGDSFDSKPPEEEGEWRGQPIYSETSKLATVKTLTPDAAEVQAVRFQAVYRPVLGDYLDLGGASQEGETVFALKSVESGAVVGMACVTFNVTDKTFVVKGLLDKASPDRLLLENGELSLKAYLGFRDLGEASVHLDEAGPVRELLMPSTVTVLAVSLVPGDSATTEMKIVPMSWDFT